MAPLFEWLAALPADWGREQDAAAASAAHACREVVQLVGDLIDSGHAGAVVELYADDALLHTAEGIIRGRDALQAYYARRESMRDRRTRHLLAAVRTERTAPDLMRVTSTQLWFVLDGEAPDARPRSMSACIDDLRRSEDGRWRIASRRLTRLLGTGARGDRPADG